MKLDASRFTLYPKKMRIVNPVGKKGEDIAVDFLKKKGYTILERNYRKKYAEIDIICVKNNTLVFVEVKTRTSTAYGTPFESITPWKLRPVMRLAAYYQMTHTQLPTFMRIDAIGVALNALDKVEEIEHLENISGF